MRIDFKVITKDILAKRAGYHCSNPDCRKLTIGPNKKKDKSSSIGVAAHIVAASNGGPRSGAARLSFDEISSIDNGIWLCSNCASLIDKDEERYSINVLRNWKQEAESFAERSISTNSKTNLNQVVINGVHFENFLDATWALFFQKLNWPYEYKPIVFDDWWPKFHIITANNKFYVDIILSGDFDKKKRQLIGKATKYSKDVLIVSEHPFHESNPPGTYPNCIGFTSISGEIEDRDQEYCVSFVYDFWGEGLDIHNICNLDYELHDIVDIKNEFCRELWKRCKNNVTSMTTNWQSAKSL